MKHEENGIIEGAGDFDKDHRMPASPSQHAAIGASPPATSETKLPSERKLPISSTNAASLQTSTRMTSLHASTCHPLAHIAYTVDFHSKGLNIWSSSTDDDDLLKAIFNSTDLESTSLSSSSTATSTTDSKVIVVLELPSGGGIEEFNVNGNNDLLNVSISKHALMLNPNAIAFAGVKTGTLDRNIDGPQTHRGDIRLNECAKALHAFKQRMQITSDKTKQVIPMSIKLPVPVAKSTVKHFTYCFDSSEYNQLQYAIAYFEFDTLESYQSRQKSTKKSSFTTGASMIFSNQKSNDSCRVSSSAHSQCRSTSRSTSSSSQNNTSRRGTAPINHRNHLKSIEEEDEDEEDKMDVDDDFISSSSSTTTQNSEAKHQKVDIEAEVKKRFSYEMGKKDQLLQAKEKEYKDNLEKANARIQSFKQSQNEKLAHHENIIDNQEEEIKKQRDTIEKIKKQANRRIQKMQQALQEKDAREKEAARQAAAQEAAARQAAEELLAIRSAAENEVARQQAHIQHLTSQHDTMAQQLRAAEHHTDVTTANLQGHVQQNVGGLVHVTNKNGSSGESQRLTPSKRARTSGTDGEPKEEEEQESAHDDDSSSYDGTIIIPSLEDADDEDL